MAAAATPRDEEIDSGLLRRARPDHRRPAPRHVAQALDVMLPYRRGRI
jgi:hypothetical protein